MRTGIGDVGTRIAWARTKVAPSALTCSPDQVRERALVASHSEGEGIDYPCAVNVTFKEAPKAKHASPKTWRCPGTSRRARRG
jgi:hypothetical protein